MPIVMLLHALVVGSVALRRRIERLLAAAPVRFAVGKGVEPLDVPIDGHLDALGLDLVLVEHRRLRGTLAAKLRQLRERTSPPPPDQIVFTDREDPEQRARLLADGALAVLNRSLGDEALAEALRAVVVRAQTTRAHLLRAARRARPNALEEWRSEAPAMQSMLALARRTAVSDTTVLLTGETGVGKEHLARAMHDASARGGGPFVAVNCGALSEQLLESELFGHVQGAFTGALRAHRGLFELAHGGTLLLDEVGDMPAVLQVKLLRVLQERRMHPVGAETDVAIDVRVIAATNRDLYAEQQAGRFRRDLYYRLAVVTLRLPPLRERREDLPELVNHHLQRLSARTGRRVPTVDAAAMAMLGDYEWPGNVRELANVLERALLLLDGDELCAGDLSLLAPKQRSSASSSTALDLAPTGALSFAAAEAQVLEQFTREYLTALLVETHGHLGAAARRSGLSPRALYGKLQRLGLDKRTFRRQGEAGSRDAVVGER